MTDTVQENDFDAVADPSSHLVKDCHSEHDQTAIVGRRLRGGRHASESLEKSAEIRRIIDGSDFKCGKNVNCESLGRRKSGERLRKERNEKRRAKGEKLLQKL